MLGYVYYRFQRLTTDIQADFDAWLKHTLELQRSRKPGEPNRAQPGRGEGVAVNTRN